MLFPQPKSPTDSKPRKPVGGVSMFGGMDPFAAKKKPTARPKSPGLSKLLVTKLILKRSRDCLIYIKKKLTVVYSL